MSEKKSGSRVGGPDSPEFYWNYLELFLALFSLFYSTFFIFSSELRQSEEHI